MRYPGQVPSVCLKSKFNDHTKISAVSEGNSQVNAPERGSSPNFTFEANKSEYFVMRT